MHAHKQLGNYFLSEINNRLGIEYARHKQTDFTPSLLNNLGTLYLDQGEGEKAARIFEWLGSSRTIESNPDRTAQNQSNLAYAYVKMDDSVSAFKAYAELFSQHSHISPAPAEYNSIISDRNYGTFLIDHEQ